MQDTSTQAISNPTTPAAALARVDITARAMAHAARDNADPTDTYRAFFDALRVVADMLDCPLGVVLSEVSAMDETTARIRRDLQRRGVIPEDVT
ncbi:hypothetical protein, partial [Intrasporangium chromatireducens]|uniref:hypothetical protein n=1 Tax=Intrasporangium chromatireducens TaxID=1386088 RepID=UPI00054EE95D